MLFAVILTPHPVGELLFITKKRSSFFGSVEIYCEQESIIYF